MSSNIPTKISGFQIDRCLKMIDVCRSYSIWFKKKYKGMVGKKLLLHLWLRIVMIGFPLCRDLKFYNSLV